MDTRGLASLAVVVILATLVIAQQDVVRTPPKDTARPALVEYMGRDGNIMGREFHRIMDSAEWVEVWARHAHKQKKDLEWAGSYPKIDFTRCMVVAFFRGKAVNTRGEELKEVDEDGGTLRLRFCSSTYQSMSFEGEDLGEPAVSYGIWVLPRSTKAVVVEEDVQSVIGGSPIWKEQARFEPVKE